MQDTENPQHRAILRRIAHLAMLERGLAPDFPLEALVELEDLKPPSTALPAPQGESGGAKDLRELPWCSIDDDESRDLDQLTAASALPDGGIRILVAVADVDVLVKKGMALDGHAKENTTSVYTVAEVFPMLPEDLSTDLTSLNPDSDRFSIVIDMSLDADGTLLGSEPYRAIVRNRAKLSYRGVGAWLEAGASGPAAGPNRGTGSGGGVEDSLRLQDRMAVALKSLRIKGGAIDLETLRARPVFVGNELKDMLAEKGNRAKDIIAELMIAANGVVARYLASKGVPSLRRVVRVPKRWDRIAQLAAERGCELPARPDSCALERFLAQARSADPLGFPDLSLSVVKLLGRGEYVAQLPGALNGGHFGLAVKDYAHATAPNRRYPDLIDQRLLKAALAGLPSPYGMRELEEAALHCTEKEDAANKVERQVDKSAAALLLRDRIGETFEAVVTGASEKGTYVRILSPMAEGRLEIDFAGMDVGQKLRVELLSADVERGYLDFKKAPEGRKLGHGS
jgi:exoribonuclease-2